MRAGRGEGHRDVHLGSWARAAEFGPYDLIVCNPPYVPDDPSGEGVQLPSHLGPARAWDAGYDGRLVLDPLCEAASELLADRGTLLIVQSEFAGPSDHCDVGQLRSGRRSHCLAMDSL